MNALLILLGTFAIVIGAIAWRGYVLSIIWSWFMVPVFHLPELMVAQAIGIAAVVSFLTNHGTTNTPKDPEKSAIEQASEGVAQVFIVPLGTLFLCWILKVWFM